MKVRVDWSCSIYACLTEMSASLLISVLSGASRLVFNESPGSLACADFETKSASDYRQLRMSTRLAADPVCSSLKGEQRVSFCSVIQPNRGYPRRCDRCVSIIFSILSASSSYSVRVISALFKYVSLQTQWVRISAPSRIQSTKKKASSIQIFAWRNSIKASTRWTHHVQRTFFFHTLEKTRNH